MIRTANRSAWYYIDLEDVQFTARQEERRNAIQTRRAARERKREAQRMKRRKAAQMALQRATGAALIGGAACVAYMTKDCTFSLIGVTLGAALMVSRRK